jgi:hypothetical protein
VGKTIKINLQRKMFTRKNIIMKTCDTKHSASKSRLKFFEKKKFLSKGNPANFNIKSLNISFNPHKIEFMNCFVFSFRETKII